MSSKTPQAFLIFSGFNLRAVVAFCRALNRDGRPFHIIACTKSDPIFRTSWRSNVAATREGSILAMDEMERCIRLATAKTGITSWCIAPSSEYFVRWCLECREKLASLGCNLPLPDRATYLSISDKRPFTDYCRARGLSVPAEGSSPEEVGWPCVAKPIVNVTADGESLYPWLLQNAKDFASFRARNRPENFFFQEWVYGESIYLLLHVDRQGCCVSYSQRNLAQQPGGKSVVLAEPADFHLTATARDWETVLRDLGFFGLVMIELRLSSEGKSVLIEANPRLWGPLQLTVDGCPELLDAYFADNLGSRVNQQRQRKPHSRATYLWFGGARKTWRAGESLTWHTSNNRCGPWSLIQWLHADVYLRRDTYYWFWQE